MLGEAEKMKRRAAEDQGREEGSRSPAEDGGACHAAQRLLRRGNTCRQFRRYRMSKGLFMNILHGVREFDPYFKLKLDAVGVLGFSSIRSAPPP
ncbi:hypothetical protein QYE76_052749 [Lolium multiflorum]|uniref:Uncharacterized protein n=1 Tax=Lolium multiflorum TaxID=4521 RepID=A0AAD8SVX7_LOLMU|nr:hypothetical protein QYE76_052749 [Lolium multiflorum]